MAEQKQTNKQEKQDKQQKPQKEEKAEVKKRPNEQVYESLTRISGYDIPGTRNIYAGLTRIKGISWTISNLICLKLGLQRTKKISELSKDEIKKIEDFLVNLETYDFLKNRRLDPETGTTSHIFGSDLDVTREFDIKRMKKMKSYKGIRHTAKLPVRGQRTRSHFRTRGRGSTGIKGKTKPKVEGAK